MEKSTSSALGRRTFLGLSAGGFLLAARPQRVQAAPVADLWDRWLQHEAESRYSLDHSAWDALLKRYLVSGADGGINRFRYAEVTAEDRDRLAQYLSALSTTLISQYNRDEQFAFWLNLYNALVVKLVIDHYPVSSIREIDIAPSLFDSGPWGADLASVEETPLSLDDIEHRILRPIWKDPRVHYVINCAALGCPQLPAMAMTADNREAMLEEAARAFINHPRGVKPTRSGLVVSRIYDWYVSDFGGYDGALIAHFRDYAAPPLAAALAEEPSISGYDYDWSLNDARQPASG
ncbi:MAG: DUF547 domain-containing protein [Rhodovibrionaceae bacterium]